jgi:S-DNA-T family DNA segregation ATPase FtsK/SpoIIIE
MRISRTNLPPASFGDTEPTSQTEQNEESIGLRRLKAASHRASEQGKGNWDSHFFLAPNVRFTRTPERDIRGASDGQPEPHELEEAEALAKAPTVEQLREVLSTMMILQGGMDMGTANATAPVQPINDNVETAVHTVQMPPATQPQATARTQHAIPAQPKRQTPFSALSDFAFWEALGSAVEDEPELPQIRRPLIPAPAVRTVARPAETPAAPTQSAPAAAAGVPAAVAAFPAPSALSMYRSVEVRAPSSQPTEPAPAAGHTASQPAIPETAAQGTKSPFPWSRRLVEQTTAIQPVSSNTAPTIVPASPALPVLVAEVSKAAEPAGIAVSKPFKIEPVAKARTLKGEYEFPPRALLQDPPATTGFVMTQEQLERNAGLLEAVLEDFGIRGEIIHVRPGPVVTLYEFEPAPGVKSSRVIGLADDIARSMSALSARVAVVPGRNVIGIELPNATRETVYFGELIDSQDFSRTGYKLPLCLGKTIGGEPVIAELAKMPHLLVAGTTGSGKSVAINTMILSLLYRLTPEECRLIMVDPKMLELSVYDGIPHLLTPVVTDPKKAVLALKWAVREMEDRYRKMSRLGVRNIDGYNARAAEARARGEVVTQVVQTGFEKGTGEPIHENQEIDLSPMPYIVVIVDEMADLMMVAGKEIEGAIQRLAQMARAAGIHLIMATQRPSVDVITGTIKANFPTRISFQVTSKIDSRTILGEQGAEQLLGQGDMLHMAGGGRIVRVHGPFVSDQEVEKVVAHLKTQGRPEYLDTVTVDEEEDDEEEQDTAVFDKSDMAAEDGNDLYDKAVKVILRDKKCSTSYIQRRLGIGYNRAASLVERMEKEGLVGPANHVGKREILNGSHDRDATAGLGGEE